MARNAEHATQIARWKRANPDRHRQQSRESWDRTQYGLEPGEREQMRQNQGGGCAICGRVTERLCIDHDHITGQVRGLLCVSCNSAIGKLLDDPDLLRQAILYLEAY